MLTASRWKRVTKSGSGKKEVQVRKWDGGNKEVRE
jgi:hypothetical protein